MKCERSTDRFFYQMNYPAASGLACLAPVIERFLHSTPTEMHRRGSGRNDNRAYNYKKTGRGIHQFLADAPPGFLSTHAPVMSEVPTFFVGTQSRQRLRPLCLLHNARQGWLSFFGDLFIILLFNII